MSKRNLGVDLYYEGLNGWCVDAHSDKGQIIDKYFGTYEEALLDLATWILNEIKTNAKGERKEEPKEFHSFDEALKAFRAGKAIKFHDWAYWYYKDDRNGTGPFGCESIRFDDPRWLIKED
jgi:hypothetical protein